MMDHEAPVTEDELHAYVDGELPADRQAAVESWLAAHPEDAARVSAWRAQADAIRSGQTLRTQLWFADYLAKRSADPTYTFRKHLRVLGGAIEE